MSEKKIEPAYVPASELEKLIYSGNPDGVVSFFSSLAPSDFVKHRKEVQRIAKPMDEARFAVDASVVAWRGRDTDRQRRALSTARFICGSLDEQIDGCWGFMHDEASFVALWRQFPPAPAQSFAEAMLAKSGGHFRAVQALVVAGIITRPLHDNYVLGLLALPMESDRVMGVRTCLERDPGLLHDTLLRLFDLEGSSESSLAGNDKYGHGLNTPRNTWSGLFLELCEKGVYSRSLLIGKALGTLEKDWIQFRSSWFSRFHDALAPTAVEMAPYAECYLGLCHSRIAPTVTLALAALEKLVKAGVLSGGDVVAALRPVMSSSVKSQVDAALRVLDLVVAKDASLSVSASETAIVAFAHPAADIHKKLIAKLKAWGLDEANKQAARELLPLVSAANRDALAAMLGGAPVAKTEPAQNGKEAPDAQLPALRPPLSALDDSRLLVPIDQVDELVDCIAYVLENTTDIDALERVLDALLRLGPFSADHKKRFSPVLKRAHKLKPLVNGWSDADKPAARELARLLVFLLEGEKLAPPASYAKGQRNAHGFLCERVQDLMDLASQGQSVSPLAAPTHRRGFIAPHTLIARYMRHYELGISAPLHEQVLSLLRLAPAADKSVLAMAETLPQTPYGRALRYALGMDVPVGEPKPLYVAAGRIRHPHADDASLMAAFGELGPDGPHAARYTFSVTTSKGDGYTFHYGHIDPQPLPRLVEPDYLAIMRHPVKAETDWGETLRNHFGADNESLTLLSATLLPSSLEAFFAEAVFKLSNNLDWWEAQWYNKAYLALLLDPTVPYTPMAYLALACGLAGKEPGQTAMAIDALVAGWTEGRIDVSQLGAVLRQLMQTPLVKLARYGKSLSTAARAHAQAPRLVFEVLCEMLRLECDAAPKDTAALLELLLELGLQLGSAMPAATRTAIEKMQLSGKGNTAQKELLLHNCPR